MVNLLVAPISAPVTKVNCRGKRRLVLVERSPASAEPPVPLETDIPVRSQPARAIGSDQKRFKSECACSQEVIFVACRSTEVGGQGQSSTLTPPQGAFEAERDVA